MKPKEFGSEFQYLEGFYGKRLSILEKENILYASGRMALCHLISNHSEWNRIWIPKYFCYEVTYALEQTGINIEFYNDSPIKNDNELLGSLIFEKGDVLLRMNYFGLRQHRSNTNIPIPVIEDHSHDLISEWSINSDADYCFASIRKSMPIAEGGILWSPKNLSLPKDLECTSENNHFVDYKYRAMILKSAYLNGDPVNKEAYLKGFRECEEMVSCLKMSSVDNKSKKFIESFDFNKFNSIKLENWKALTTQLKPEIKILWPEKEGDIPFSLILSFHTYSHLLEIRKALIDKNIYPAILWPQPEMDELQDNYLSIHCDGRYNTSDMEYIAKTINEVY